MNWPWKRSKSPSSEYDTKIDSATKKVDDIASRGEVVARKLEGRLARNHWGETVAAIARREEQQW